jgi:hypothetical protein
MININLIHYVAQHAQNLIDIDSRKTTTVVNDLSDEKQLKWSEQFSVKITTTIIITIIL